MKIIVVSDSHGEVELLSKILLFYQDADYFFHLGDSELPPHMLQGYLSVKGNCDYFEYPEFIDLELPFGKVHLEHGHFSKCRNEKYIKEHNIKLFLSGHTHVKNVSKVGDCYFANPGSLTYPRDDNEGTFLIIKYEKNEFSFETKHISCIFENKK